MTGDSMQDDMIRGVARLMVRRHLADLIRPGIGTEDQFVEMFTRCMRLMPDASMRDVAAALRATVERLQIAHLPLCSS